MDAKRSELPITPIQSIKPKGSRLLVNGFSRKLVEGFVLIFFLKISFKLLINGNK